jgi:hypothetical protein
MKEDDALDLVGDLPQQGVAGSGPNRSVQSLAEEHRIALVAPESRLPAIQNVELDLFGAAVVALSASVSSVLDGRENLVVRETSKASRILACNLRRKPASAALATPLMSGQSSSTSLDRLSVASDSEMTGNTSGKYALLAVRTSKRLN